MTDSIRLDAKHVHAICDQLATPPKANKPLAGLANPSATLEPYIKETMPVTKGLASDPLDAVAYANPLGYLPEIRALVDRGADSFGLLAWTAQMESIAVYCAARVLERALPDRAPVKKKSFKIADADAQVIAGDLTVTGDLQNGGTLAVLGNLTVGGVVWDREPACQLVVLGSIEARALNLSGGLAVRGNVTCHSVLFANDHGSTLFVGGTVKSPLLVLDDKSLRAAKLAAKLTLDSRAIKKAAVTKAKKALVAQVFRDEEDEKDGDEAMPLDLEAFVVRLMKNRPLFR